MAGISLGAIGAAILGSAATQTGNTLMNWGISRNLNDQTYEQQKDLFNLTSAFNAAEAQKQRAWEQEMSSTAYQRQVADMEAAGINPAALGGTSFAGGASTPSGMAASASGGSRSSVGFTPGHGSSIFSSALSGLLAKDRDAAWFLAQEVRDNAKHAYRMEENLEKEENRTIRELTKEEARHHNSFNDMKYKHNLDKIRDSAKIDKLKELEEYKSRLHKY